MNYHLLRHFLLKLEAVMMICQLCLYLVCVLYFQAQAAWIDSSSDNSWSLYRLFTYLLPPHHPATSALNSQLSTFSTYFSPSDPIPYIISHTCYVSVYTNYYCWSMVNVSLLKSSGLSISLSISMVYAALGSLKTTAAKRRERAGEAEV